MSRDDPPDELAEMRRRKTAPTAAAAGFVLRLPGCAPVRFPSFREDMRRADAFVAALIDQMKSQRDRT